MQTSVRRDDSRRVHVHPGTRTHEYYALYIVYNQAQQAINRDLWRRNKCSGFEHPTAVVVLIPSQTLTLCSYTPQLFFP